jgi:exonuclease VII small subunit
MEIKLFISEIENAKVTLDEAIILYNSGIKVGHLVFTTEIHKKEKLS